MLSQPVIEFTQIRAPHEAVVNIAGVDLQRKFVPFSCSTFSKSSVCFEQELGQRHQCQCQCIRVHHTGIPARMPSMENITRISLFVTKLFLRNRVSDHHVHVSASSRPIGLRSSHVHDPVAESASKRFDFVLWHKLFDDFSLFVLALSSSFHDFTL